MKKLLVSIFLILTFFSHKAFAVEGDFFEIEGEQLVYKVSTQWRPVWMSGDPKANFFVEYIPEYEQINNWKFGYLKIQRHPYPAPEIMEKIKASGGRISDIAAQQFQEQTSKNCLGKHEKMTHRTNTFNNLFFSVTGGFCNKYGSVAPYGEGAVFAFIEGKDFLHSVQYGWRPIDEKTAKENAPWGVFSPLLIQYLNEMKLITTCNSSAENSKSCNNKYPIRVTSESAPNPPSKKY